MPSQKLTIIVPEDETVEGVVEVVQEWLSRGMTSGYYPNWTLADVTERPPASAIAQQVLDNHAIKPHWVRSGEQMLKLLAEAVSLDRGESTQVDPPTELTAKEITERVLTMESLGTWEQRIEAAVFIARGRVKL